MAVHCPARGGFEDVNAVVFDARARGLFATAEVCVPFSLPVVALARRNVRAARPSVLSQPCGRFASAEEARPRYLDRPCPSPNSPLNSHARPCGHVLLARHYAPTLPDWVSGPHPVPLSAHLFLKKRACPPLARQSTSANAAFIFLTVHAIFEMITV